jgi:hypothetical protein
MSSLEFERQFNCCYWCASKLTDKEFLSCPKCNNQLFQALPVSQNEKYTVTIDDNNSINLKFT